MRTIALLLLSHALFAAETSLEGIFRSYLDAQAATMRRGATEEAVDRLLTFYTDDAVYEDPKVNVRVEGKARMRAGRVAHLSDYAGSADETQVKVESVISQANAVAAVVTEVFWINGRAGREEVRRKRLQVAEFRGAKICRLIDYH